MPLTLRRIVAICAVVAVAVVLYQGVNSARTALVMEDNLQSFMRVQAATIDYAEHHNGEWPRSWDDLPNVRTDIDIERDSERVTIDFDVDPDVIVTQTAETFTAIQPREPCFDTSHRVEGFIAHLREIRSGSEGPYYHSP